jgi:hypothetical protein
VDIGEGAARHGRSPNTTVGTQKGKAPDAVHAES